MALEYDLPLALLPSSTKEGDESFDRKTDFRDNGYPATRTTSEGLNNDDEHREAPGKTSKSLLAIAQNESSFSVHRLSSNSSYYTSTKSSKIGTISNYTSMFRASRSQPLRCKVLLKSGKLRSAFYPVFPHMILVGVQKAGTSAIHEALQRIPNFMQPRQSEPHFWDGKALPALKRGNMTQSEMCALAEQYASYWPSLMTELTSSTVVYEKTPRLMAIPDTAWAIRTFLDVIRPKHPVKILVLLRDPIERFYSHYKMEYQRKRTQLRVEDVIKSEVASLVQDGILHAPKYNESIPLGVDNEMWSSSLFYPGTSIPQNYTGFIARGFYSKQLMSYMKFFTLEKSLLVLRYEDFRQSPVETLESIMKFIRGKEIPVTEEARLALGTDLGPVFTKYADVQYPLSNHSQQYLRRLYKPFNDELAEMLGESWRNVWT